MSPFLDTDELKVALRARTVSGAFKRRATGMFHWRQDLAHLSCLFKKILLQGVSKFEREGEGDLRLLKKYGPH